MVGGLEASGSGSRLEDPVGTFSRAGICSREAPGFARLFEQARGQTAGDSRPPNAMRLLKPVLKGATTPDYPAVAGRLGTSTRRRNSHTVSSRWFQPTVSTVTMPRSGLLCDSRLSSTVVRA